VLKGGYLVKWVRNTLSLEMWCWGRMVKTNWTDRVRHKELLRNVEEQRNVLHKIDRKNANWIGHTLHRNCLLKHVTRVNKEGKIEVKGRRGRRCKQLLDEGYVSL
jgi:hypothetical protein